METRILFIGGTEKTSIINHIKKLAQFPLDCLENELPLFDDEYKKAFFDTIVCDIPNLRSTCKLTILIVKKLNQCFLQEDIDILIINNCDKNNITDDEINKTCRILCIKEWFRIPCETMIGINELYDEISYRIEYKTNKNNLRHHLENIINPFNLSIGGYLNDTCFNTKFYTQITFIIRGEQFVINTALLIQHIEYDNILFLKNDDVNPIIELDKIDEVDITPECFKYSFKIICSNVLPSMRILLGKKQFKEKWIEQMYHIYRYFMINIYDFILQSVIEDDMYKEYIGKFS